MKKSVDVFELIDNDEFVGENDSRDNHVLFGTVEEIREFAKDRWGDVESNMEYSKYPFKNRKGYFG